MGNIKVSASVFLLATLLAVGAQAERWIVKNPKHNASVEFLRGLNSISNLQFKNQYVIIDSNVRTSARELMNEFAAENAFEDLAIGIDQPIKEEFEAPKGWHTQNLEYKNLNPEYAGQGVIVAVLDTGVDYTHSDLAGRMWKNVNEIPDNNIDDDNNGLIDDYHGYNFNDRISDPQDTQNHGTHCAGIIAAKANPTSGAQGVAPGVKIMPLAIIGSNGGGFLADAATAVKYAVDNGAKVLSNSWRVYKNWNEYMNPEGLKLLEEAIAYAGEHKVIFAGAAGNETKDLEKSNLLNPIYPLSFSGLPNMIGVASTELKPDGEEQISYFSNYGVKSIAVAAPGSDIHSTVPGGAWAMMSGTSMATPVVAGTLARGLSKGYTMEEALEKLNQTTKNTTYWQQYVIHGRIDIKKYLE